MARATVRTLLAAAFLAGLTPAISAQLQFDALGKRGLPSASGTLAVASGDVDGDGDLDLVFGNAEVVRFGVQFGGRGAGAQKQLCLNDGTGTFTDATSTHMPVDADATTALALGDVDRDGDLDLVLANLSYVARSQNRLYLNDGSGTFTDATALRLPSVLHGSSRAVALGDVDGDGDLDAVFGIQGQSLLYLNDGSGVFADATATRLPASNNSTTALALGDVDGDGDLDLALGNNGQSQLWLNGGTGTFTDATVTLIAGA